MTSQFCCIQVGLVDFFFFKLNTRGGHVERICTCITPSLGLLYSTGHGAHMDSSVQGLGTSEKVKTLFLSVKEI